MALLRVTKGHSLFTTEWNSPVGLHKYSFAKEYLVLFQELLQKFELTFPTLACWNCKGQEDFCIASQGMSFMV